MVGTKAKRPEDPVPLGREGLDALYRRHAAWLKRTLRGRVGKAAVETEDIVQEAYIRLARYPAREAGRNPKALLLTIAVNLVRDELRRSAVRHNLAQDLDADAPAAGTAADDPERLLATKQVILSLPRKFRDVFVLSRFGGMTYPEIAERLGISVQTVQWRMERALSMCLAGLQE